jgi:sterol desaturase/sphingolipid hydroxylase (fatty acid hydroxylase superfamily)
VTATLLPAPPPSVPILSRRSWAGLALLAAAVVVTLLTRPGAIVGLALLAVVLIPLERIVPLRRRRVLRPGLVTDLTHVLVNGVLVAAATFVLVVGMVLPWLPLRALDLESALPGAASAALLGVVALVGSYWGHRLTHEVPFLWRFHAVHHSIEHMDWMAAGRLHPIDSAVTQACAIVPLVALGYDAGPVATVTILVTFLAIFQHANVRLRFPVLRWVLPTPEWHHWHHATDPDAHDTNFGIPVVDLIFGTAYLPKDRRPEGFGIPDPVPAEGYVAHLRYPFRRSSDRDGRVTATA